MEPSGELSTLQTRAEQFLQGWLHNCAANDIPRKVAQLAVAPKNNPVKELFRVADTHAPLLSTSSNNSGPSELEPSPHRSKFSLRFGRNKDKAKAGASAQHDHQGVFQADVKLSHDELEAIQHNLQRTGYLPESFGKVKASPASAYNCIFCRTDYTTKGTCKRHLEDIHVAKRYFRCVTCKQKFTTAPEARKHCQTCGMGILGWNTETPEAHKVYSSEFVSHQTFSTLQSYVNHLLELSAASAEGRPVRSWHKKLRNLLEQPPSESALHSLSLRLFHSEDGWQNVRWEHERVKKAVKELEHGILEHDQAPGDMLKLHRVERFLEELFQDRALNTTITSNSPSRQTTAVPMLKVEPDVEIQEEAPPTQRTELTPKRPLSFESSAVLPRRQPPGPPTPSRYLQQPPNPGEQSQYQLQQPQSIAVHHIPETQYAPTHQHTLPQRSVFDVQQLDESPMYWAPPEQQPPPYESAFSLPEQMQCSPQARIDPPQHFVPMSVHASYGHDSTYYSDISASSTVASPTTYMPTPNDAMGFYTNTPMQIQSAPQQQAHISNGMMPYSPMAYVPAPTHPMSNNNNTQHPDHGQHMQHNYSGMQ